MTEIICQHSLTTLNRIEKSERDDCERISYRECRACGASVMTVEVRVPDGMSVTAALNRIKQFLEDSK